MQPGLELSQRLDGEREREVGDLPSPPCFYVLYLEAAVSPHMSAASVCSPSRVPALIGIWSHYLPPVFAPSALQVVIDSHN